jgi:hypothetical protein
MAVAPPHRAAHRVAGIHARVELLALIGFNVDPGVQRKA